LCFFVFVVERPKRGEAADRAVVVVERKSSFLFREDLCRDVDGDDDVDICFEVIWDAALVRYGGAKAWADEDDNGEKTTANAVAMMKMGARRPEGGRLLEEVCGRIIIVSLRLYYKYLRLFDC